MFLCLVLVLSAQSGSSTPSKKAVQAGACSFLDCQPIVSYELKHPNGICSFLISLTLGHHEAPFQDGVISTAMFSHNDGCSVGAVSVVHNSRCWTTFPISCVPWARAIFFWCSTPSLLADLWALLLPHTSLLAKALTPL